MFDELCGSVSYASKMLHFKLITWDCVIKPKWTWTDEGIDGELWHCVFELECPIWCIYIVSSMFLWKIWLSIRSRCQNKHRFYHASFKAGRTSSDAICCAHCSGVNVRKEVFKKPFNNVIIQFILICKLWIVFRSTTYWLEQ